MVENPIPSVEMFTPSELYEANISEGVHRVMKAQYAPHELDIIGENKASGKEEDLQGASYQFQSPAGEFLDQNQALYLKLRTAHPYHEQGRLAKDLALIAVEVADEEYTQGRGPEATIAYQVGEAAADIALGVTPYVGLGKDVYEALTGRHLLTGRRLTGF